MRGIWVRSSDIPHSYYHSTRPGNLAGILEMGGLKGSAIGGDCERGIFITDSFDNAWTWGLQLWYEDCCGVFTLETDGIAILEIQRHSEDRIFPDPRALVQVASSYVLCEDLVPLSDITLSFPRNEDEMHLLVSELVDVSTSGWSPMQDVVGDYPSPYEEYEDEEEPEEVNVDILAMRLWHRYRGIIEKFRR